MNFAADAAPYYVSPGDVDRDRDAVIGIWRARKVEMTGMPELIALLHSFVGAAAVMVGFNAFLQRPDSTGFQQIEVFLGVFIGAVTFTGSLVAWGKLNGKLPSKALGCLIGHKTLPAAMRGPRSDRQEL